MKTGDPDLAETQGINHANRGTAQLGLIARDDGHGFAKKRNADFQFYATVMFVEQYLLK